MKTTLALLLAGAPALFATDNERRKTDQQTQEAISKSSTAATLGSAEVVIGAAVFAGAVTRGGGAAAIGSGLLMIGDGMNRTGSAPDEVSDALKATQEQPAATSNDAPEIQAGAADDPNTAGKTDRRGGKEKAKSKDTKGGKDKSKGKREKGSTRERERADCRDFGRSEGCGVDRSCERARDFDFGGDRCEKAD